MPHGKPDETDPMILNGVSVETDDLEATREMAACFAEEFLRMGYTAQGILKMFQAKEFSGPHLAYQTLGESAIRLIIDEHIRIRGPHKVQRPLVVEHDAEGESALSILDT